jgi:dynein heavy chain
VIPFLKKCFESVDNIEFKKCATQDIIAMFSAEQERIGLVQPVIPNPQVETWLLELEKSMRSSLRDISRRSLKAMQTEPREKWVLDWPGQVR